MSHRDSTSRRSALGRLLGAAFGGPLLRIPAARTRESRRLRFAVVASVLFHCSLLAGGALLTAVGSLRGGGTMAAVEIVLDTRSLATGPLVDRAYAPQRETAERAPEETPAESIEEESLPTLAQQAPPTEAPAEAEAPESLPDDQPPTALAALEPELLADASEPPDLQASDQLPDTLETPRGSDSVFLPQEEPAPVAPPALADASAPPPDAPLPQVPADPVPAEAAVAPDLATAVATAPPAPAPTEPEEPAAPPAAAAPTPPVPVLQPPSPPRAPQIAALTPPAPPPAPNAPTRATALPPLLAPPAPETVAPIAAEAQTADAAEPPIQEAEPLSAPQSPAPPVPQLAAAETESEQPVPEQPTPIDRLLSSITPASLETAAPPGTRDDADLPPQLDALEPPQSPGPEPDRPPADLASAVPPALYLPSEPPPSAVTPPPLAEDTPPPIGPVNWTEPFAPPPPDPRRVDPATRARLADALDAEISAILSEIECGDLHADAGADGRLSVRGYVTSLQEQAAIRDRLLGIADVRGVSDEEVVVIAEGLCDGLAVYSAGAAVAPDPEPMDHLPPALRLPPIFGMQQGARAEFVEGQYLDIHVESPDFPAHVTIDYFKPDGTVVHLLPSEWNTAAYYPEPATPIAIANREPGDISVLAGPPFGTGMVVTLSTSEPLFVSLDERPLEENAEAYLARLDEILRDKERDPEFRAQYGYVFVDAVRNE